MKILITGTAGFIGSHLANKLRERGDEVVGLDSINDYYDIRVKYGRLDRAGIRKEDIEYNRFLTSSTDPIYKFIKLNLEDKDNLSSLFKNEKFDAVCNLAAQAGVRYSLENPDSYISSNIVGFLNILESCRNHDVRNLSYASSSSVYGLNEEVPFSTEHNVDHPISLYAASKKSNELMAHTYSHLFGISTTGLRFFTVYGPWGRPDMALFLFVKAALEGKSINVFNNGKMLRDFTYIDDIVEGITRVIDNPAKKDSEWNGKSGKVSSSSAPYKVYNIGNNNPVELMDFIRIIEEKLGISIKKNMKPLQAGDVPETYADVSDLIADFNYKPSTSIRDGVNRFVDWYIEFFGYKDRVKKMHKIAVIGLGYVGLPLAHAFSSKYKVVGYDISQHRIEELSSGIDRTQELQTHQVRDAIENGMIFTNHLNDIKECNIYIITVPTPITKSKRPDLNPLLKASEAVGNVLDIDNIVIYESTVYPGATEDECVPVLESVSGLTFNRDFYCGYSPERINPGDKEHTVTKIKKVTSGSTTEIAKIVDELYKSIIEAGTHKATSIKVAEAAKVIENSQRDINIAFVNELAMIFNKLNIDTLEVLEAAGSKWNFLPFRPGLVGGHCIGVDPYYLTHKAEEVGYNPQIILSGRRVNDNMGVFIVNQVIKLMIRKGHKIEGSNVLVLGITFKENCPDIRNTRVIDIINELQDFGCYVDVFDPWADNEEVKREYSLGLLDEADLILDKYDSIILAVAHDIFLRMEIKGNENQVLYDIKSVLDTVDGRL